MDITITKNEFRIKGKSGVLNSRTNGVLISSTDGNTSKELFGAGEFEVSGISVIGLATEEKELVFIYEVDGLRICNLNNITKKLSDSKASQVGDVDILLLPVGPSSIEMMQQLESYYVIPFGYANDEDLDKFLKESGMQVEKMTKFSLKKEEVIEESPTQIVVLEDK